MSLNKKFRTFVFSNILLGAMAFNNWANNSIYTDGITDVSFLWNNKDWSTRVTYKLNGENKRIENPKFSEMQSFFKSDNDFKDFLLGLEGSETYSILLHNIEYFKNWVSKRDDREELVVSLSSVKCTEYGWTVAHALARGYCDGQYIELLGMLKEENIMKILQKHDNRDGWTVAYELASNSKCVELLGKLKEDNIMKILELKDNYEYTVAYRLAYRSCDKFIEELLGTLREENIMKILEKCFSGNACAKELYAKEPEKFIDMINRKNFTDVQKQEINNLIGEDVFEVNAQNKNDDETVTDEIPAEKQSQSMFQRVVKFGIWIFECTKRITGFLLFCFFGVSFWDWN